MNRCCFTLVVLQLACAAAQAHHIWILPEQSSGQKARAIFSDTLKPDSPQLLDKIADAKIWVRESDGKDSRIFWEERDAAFELDVPGDRLRTIGAVCVYGVQVHDHRLRQDVEPYLLTYYAKTVLGRGASEKPWDKLTLEIMSAVTDKEVRLQVFFKGKAAPGAEMRIQTPGEDRKELKTNDNGEITITVKNPGIYGFQTRYVEKKAGEHKGHKYAEVRHHATLALPVGDKK